MKTYIKKLILIITTLLIFSLPTNAKNNVATIDIEVALLDDGSAYVTQVWEGNFDEGTECYIPIDDSGDIKISDFKVSDSLGQFALQSKWDVDASFDDKMRKCGIVNTDKGWELCFGISKYGQNRYAIEYKINDLVGVYNDSDGFNFMFVNRNMDTFPTDGKIRFLLQNGKKLDENNCKIWSFGYNGQIEFQDGNVVAYTQSPLENDNSMIVVLELDKGLITPNRKVDDSFSSVKDKAMEDSNYTKTKTDASDYIIFMIVFGIILLVIILVVVVIVKRKMAIKKMYKNANYFRDVPNHGDMEFSYYLSQNFDMADSESNIIGACLLKMINDNNIVPMTTQKVSFMGKTKTSVELKLANEPSEILLNNLYKILLKAAGEDGILQEKELEKYCERNYESLNCFMGSAKQDGEKTMEDMGGFSNGSGNSPKDLSPVGEKELLEIMGMKKYLLEFSLISERGISEIAIWKDYLIYAMLFGISETVMVEFKKVYPNNIMEFEQYDRNLFIAYSYNRSMYSAMQRSQQAARSAGSGGSSSIGGGGGFSGGGSGGGTR